MNVSASKVLLGLSITAFTWCTKDHLYTQKKQEDAPAKAATLSPAFVNRIEVLSLGRDPFESVALDRTEDTAAANAIAAATGHAPAGLAKALPPMALQGVFMTPTGHVALINGVPTLEGEETVLTDGTKVFARKIGDEYAVIEVNGRSTMLKLQTPGSAADTGGGYTPPAATPAYNAPARPAGLANTNANPTGHGGGSDPYAGHKTGRR